MKVLITLLLLTLGVNAASLDDLTYTTAGGKVTITDCDTGATGELVIPDTIEGNPVTRIGTDAFRWCRSLTNITIPDSVTSIGERAFWDCNSLTSINIPDSVTSIGANAFDDCTSLTSITIPDSVTSIGDYAFRMCNSLTRVIIGNGVTIIGAEAFQMCENVISITIPDSVTSIGDSAFSNCKNLQSITIGNGVTSIGNFVFFVCSSLTSITIPEGVVSIGSRTFQFCNELQDVYMEGPPPVVEPLAFSRVATNAKVHVPPEFLPNYGGVDGTWNELIITKKEEECDTEELRNTITTLVAQIAQKDAQIAVLENRPTQNQYDQVVAELDARPTLEDIQEARAGSVVLTPTGNGTVILKMMIEKSSDLSVWENSEESVEVELPLAEGKKFLRFALK